MSQARIIEQIQKLMALSDSPNQHEAEAAMAMATKLMAKHNLSMQMLGKREEKKFGKAELNRGKKVPSETKYIANIISRFFFADIVYNHTANGTIVTLVGKEENVEVAKFIYLQLEAIFYDLWTDYKKVNNLPANAKQSYYYGLYTGLCAKLDWQQVNAQQEMGLVLVKDPDIDNYKKSLFSNIKKEPKKKVMINSVKAQQDGIDHGQNIEFDMGRKKVGV